MLPETRNAVRTVDKGGNLNVEFSYSVLYGTKRQKEKKKSQIRLSRPDHSLRPLRVQPESESERNRNLETRAKMPTC
jgi:hypothetical protein